VFGRHLAMVVARLLAFSAQGEDHGRIDHGPGGRISPADRLLQSLFELRVSDGNQFPALRIGP